MRITDLDFFDFTDDVYRLGLIEICGNRMMCERKRTTEEGPESHHCRGYESPMHETS
jgi:hypothetical protein